MRDRLLDDMFLRDSAMTTAILSFFASAWFGWAQERPPAAWKAPLITGSVLSVVATITGGILAWQSWDSGSVLSDDGAFRAYCI